MTILSHMSTAHHKRAPLRSARPSVRAISRKTEEKSVDVIDHSDTATQLSGADATLASTGRHRYNGSKRAFAWPQGMHKGCTSGARDRPEAMSSRRNLWCRSASCHDQPDAVMTFNIVNQSWNLTGVALGVCGSFLAVWRAPQGSGERTDGSEHHEATWWLRRLPKGGV